MIVARDGSDHEFKVKCCAMYDSSHQEGSWSSSGGSGVALLVASVGVLGNYCGDGFCSEGV
jgi:hypothetical protein